MKILKILGSIGIILTFVFGVWIVDERYVTAKELSQEKVKIYLKMDVSDYRALTSQYYDYKKLVRENPDDKDLKESFNKIEKERDTLKQKIDSCLENGK